MKLINKYIAYLRYEKNFSSHTEISYFTDLSQFVDFLESKYADLNLVDVDSDVIRSWMVDMMSQKITARTVNRKLSALKSFYAYLLKIGEVKSNPATRVVGPRMIKSIPSFVNDSDMEVLLDMGVAEDEGFVEVRDGLILELLYLTGIRRAELIGLKDQDVDLNSCTIQVTGKRNKQRLIPISSIMSEKLRSYILIRDENVEDKAQAFFVKEDGLPLYPMLVYRLVAKRLTLVSTLSKTSPHVLRHTFATSMLNNGADINAVKEILGHSSLAATEVYTHTSFEELRSIYNKAHPRA